MQDESTDLVATWLNNINKDLKHFQLKLDISFKT